MGENSNFLANLQSHLSSLDKNESKRCIVLSCKIIRSETRNNSYLDYEAWLEDKKEY